MIVKLNSQKEKENAKEIWKNNYYIQKNPEIKEAEGDLL